MKYIWYAVLIIVCLSGAIGLKLMKPKPTPQKAALVINGRTISSEEFERLCSENRIRPAERERFAGELIAGQLMIQEAERQGINREEPFRKSIQNYYEQSLIKLLIDRKAASLKVEVREEEIDRYLSLQGRRLDVTVCSFDTREKAVTCVDGERRSVVLDDLSPEIQSRIISVGSGQSARPVLSEGKYVVVRLDAVGAAGAGRRAALEREDIRGLLVEAGKGMMIDDWMAEIRAKAAVAVDLGGNER